MSLDTLSDLLEQLCHGDHASAERVFLAYEPYLRLVVRRMLSPRLRSKFDSSDVVQSVWSDVLVGFRTAAWQFADAGQLKAFLIKATRNRFLDRLRQQRVPLAHERPLAQGDLERASPALDAEPGNIAEADELWQRMMSLCPPHHQTLLELKRQGCSLTDIAASTGMHRGSIRRIFNNLARRLAIAVE